MKTSVKAFGWIPIVAILFAMIPWEGSRELSTIEAIQFFAQFFALLVCVILFAFTFSRRFKKDK